MSTEDHNIVMVEFGKILCFQVVFYNDSEYFKLLVSLGFLFVIFCLFVCFKKAQLENFDQFCHKRNYSMWQISLSHSQESCSGL